MKFGVSKMFGVDIEVVPDKVVIHELPDRPYLFPIKRDSKRKMRRERGRLKAERKRISHMQYQMYKQAIS